MKKDVGSNPSIILSYQRLPRRGLGKGYSRSGRGDMAMCAGAGGEFLSGSLSEFERFPWYMEYPWSLISPAMRPLQGDAKQFRFRN